VNNKKLVAKNNVESNVLVFQDHVHIESQQYLIGIDQLRSQAWKKLTQRLLPRIYWNSPVSILILFHAFHKSPATASFITIFSPTTLEIYSVGKPKRERSELTGLCTDGMNLGHKLCYRKQVRHWPEGCLHSPYPALLRSHATLIGQCIADFHNRFRQKIELRLYPLHRSCQRAIKCLLQNLQVLSESPGRYCEIIFSSW